MNRIVGHNPKKPSIDGKYQAIVLNGGYLHLSTDYGKTWVHKGSGSISLWDIAISGTGQYMCYIHTGYGYIYLSSDYGETFTAKCIYATYRAIDISATGQYQTAAISSGYIYISSDYGQTWAQKGLSKAYNEVSISATGQYQTASSSTYLYVSSDFGQTWTQKGLSKNWVSVCMDFTGQYQVAAAEYNYIYRSTDYGQTWTAITIATKHWISVDCSATGQYITAVEYGGDIHVSNNSGSSFVLKGFYSIFHSMSMCASGQYQLAVRFSSTSQGWAAFSKDYGVTWTDIEENYSMYGSAINKFQP